MPVPEGLTGSGIQGTIVRISALQIILPSWDPGPPPAARPARSNSLLAEQGDAPARTEFGARYEDGRGGLEQNDAEAFGGFAWPPTQRDADAQHRLCMLYAEGRGVEQNDAEALRWIRLAATEQDHAGAQSSLGFMYAYGRGVEQDDAAARRLYRLAAEQDNAAARRCPSTASVTCTIWFRRGSGRR